MSNEIKGPTLYEFNQQAYNSVKPLTKKELTDELSGIFEWVNERKDKYTMLLCHELRDYTILHYNKDDKKSYKNAIMKDLLECLINRGDTLDIRYVQDQDAWQIWSRKYGDDEPVNHMYMLFDCESFVVEV